MSGTEYPMLAMESRGANQYGLYGVITHEIGHQWFPMIVGSNERMHPWMDGGFNTFINTFSEAGRYPTQGSEGERAARDRSLVGRAMQAGIDASIEAPPDRTNPRLLGLEAYTKPAVGLDILRREVLGPKLFDEAFRTYIRRWAYKHPAPANFFRSMENGSGHRLDWFWREWFLENAHLDRTIDTVSTRQAGNTELSTVMYGNRVRGLLSLHARFTFTDGTTKDYDCPAEVWSMNTSHYVRQYAFVRKQLGSIDLDPDHRLVDDDRTNNVWMPE